MQRPAQNAVNIAITSADYYPASGVAKIFSQHKHEGDSELNIILIARNPERARELVGGDVEVRQVDYNDENSLVQAFRNVDWVLLFADPEQNRAQNTCRAVDALQKANVKSVVFNSVAGAETQGRKEMNEFLEIEKKIQQTGKNYVILRNSMITNYFHLWAPCVMEHGKLSLLSDKNQKFTPLALEDVARANCDIIRQGIEKHQSKTYSLTGPETVNGQKLVDELNRALGGDAGITYQQVSRKELQSYLRSLRDRDDANLKHRFPGQPNDKQIQTLLDILEWIAAGQADFKSGDLRKITNSDGENVLKFFEKNRSEFRGQPM